MFEKADVTAVISHDFLYPMQSIDPSIIHVVFFKYIDFYRSNNTDSDIIWISSSLPNLQFIDSIRYLETMEKTPDFLDEIQFYKLPEYSELISHQRQRVETLVNELEKIRKNNRITLLVIDDMDQMIKSNIAGSIGIDQVFAMLFHTLKKSKISMVYHSPAVPSDFVTTTGERKILPRWIHSINKVKPGQIDMVFHWVVRPPKSAKLKTEERYGRYTIVRYNSRPGKEKIMIDEEDLMITDLAEGLNPVFIPGKSKRIKKELLDLLLSAPEYQTSMHKRGDQDIDIKLFRVPRTAKQSVSKFRSRTPRLSNSIWIMKYTCALKSVQKNPGVRQLHEKIDYIWPSDFDRRYTKQDLHKLHLQYMGALGLGDTEIYEVLDYFEMNSRYLGQDWLIAFVASFVYWWKSKRNWEVLDRDQMIELISSALSNQIINSWVRGSIIYDGKKVATLARKLSKSISLTDPLFNQNIDRVQRFIETRPEGSIEIITHTMKDSYFAIGKIIILNIPGIASYTMVRQMESDAELHDEFHASLELTPFESLYEAILVHEGSKIRRVNFVIIELLKEYNKDTLKMEFTELIILVENTIYRITRDGVNFTWKRLEKYENFSTQI